MSLSSNFPAIKPSLLLDFANTKQLDPRVTFARATTATYYDGVTTAMAEQNLFLQSQDFDNASWIKAFSTVTANATTAPDGTTTADLVVPNTTNNPHGLQFNVTTTGTTTISVYAKAGGYDRIVFSSNSNAYIYFNLTSGTVESTAGAGWSSPTITSVGSGWYRCVAVNSNSNTRYDILTYNALQSSGSVAPTFTGDGTSGVYLWGAQLEQRSSVTAYTATTTQQITNYIPVLMTAAAGVPRFDHNPTTDESLGLLIEEQRTNSLTYSSEFDNAAWTKGNVTITTNTIVAPDGTLTGDKIVETTASGSHNVVQSYTGALVLTASIYAKAGERSSFIFNGGNQSGVAATFNVLNGTVSNVGGATTSTSITAVGNGWYRCSMTWSNSGAVTLGVFLLSGASSSYVGDGFSGLFIWGAQLEAGAFATSYIPTVASTVTRNADAASMTGTNFSSWYSAPEGTLYCELGSLLSTSTTQVPGFNVGDSNNRIELRPVGNAIGHARGVVQVNGSGQVDISITTLASTAARKVGLVYKVNDFYITGNGSTGGASSSSGTLPVVSQAQIGTAPYDANLKTNGTIKKIAYYPMRVTNAQLQALTS